MDDALTKAKRAVLAETPSGGATGYLDPGTWARYVTAARRSGNATPVCPWSNCDHKDRGTCSYNRCYLFCLSCSVCHDVTHARDENPIPERLVRPNLTHSDCGGGRLQYHSTVTREFQFDIVTSGCSCWCHHE